jgi:TPR repeat protein
MCVLFYALNLPKMKANRLVLAVLLLFSAAVFGTTDPYVVVPSQLPAQQNEADRKLLAEIRARAEIGDAQSQFELGSAFFSGTLGVAKDYAEAVKWYRKAADQNYAEAQFGLGFCYHEGEGVTKDYAEAVKWYRKAAEQNYAEAQFGLGFCYYNGEGVTKDYAEAVKWYRKAAEQNDALAQNNLGVCSVRGDGVPKDYVESYKWMLLAAGQGDKNAKENATILENNMSREEIAEGQKLARNFKPRQVPSEGSDSSSTGIAQTRRNLPAPGSSSRRMGILSRMNMWPETERKFVWSRARV